MSRRMVWPSRHMRRMVVSPTSPPDTFNSAILLLLPKKPSSVSQHLGPAYTPANLRPISVVNTDNRIVASLLNAILAPFANTFCRPEQRGFLPNRYISTNIIDIDLAIHRSLKAHPLGARFLFDFSAACPSLDCKEQKWVLKCRRPGIRA